MRGEKLDVEMKSLLSVKNKLETEELKKQAKENKNKDPTNLKLANVAGKIIDKQKAVKNWKLRNPARSTNESLMRSDKLIKILRQREILKQYKSLITNDEMCKEINDNLNSLIGSLMDNQSDGDLLDEERNAAIRDNEDYEAEIFNEDLEEDDIDAQGGHVESDGDWGGLRETSKEIVVVRAP